MGKWLFLLGVQIEKKSFDSCGWEEELCVDGWE